MGAVDDPVGAYLVSLRTREIGIRLAIGADPSQMLGMVVGYGVSLAVVGIVAGLAGALVLTRLMQDLLYKVAPDDPLTLVAVAAASLLVAMMASVLPARRATRVSPTFDPTSAASSTDPAVGEGPPC